MRLMTPSEAAETLGVHRRTVARWADAGRIECVRTLGGHRRYLVSSVREVEIGVPEDDVDLSETIPFLHRYLITHPTP